MTDLRGAGSAGSSSCLCSACEPNVDSVLIAGRVMKRSGQMVGLDLARFQRLGDEARDRVYAAAKVKNSRV